MSDLFAAAGLDKSAPRPLADRLRPQTLADVADRPILSARPARSRDCSRPAVCEPHPLGSAGDGEDDGCPPARRPHELAFEQLLGDLLGRPGFAQSVRPRQGAARPRAGDAALHRRDPPLQSRAAGQLPAVHGRRHDHAGSARRPRIRRSSSTAAVLSRAMVLVFNRLDEAAMEDLLARAEATEGRRCRSTPTRARLSPPWPTRWRALLNLAEEVFAAAAPGTPPLDREGLTSLVQRRAPLYDKGRERPLQSHQCPAQIRPRLRSRRRALLARAHARRRRRPAVHRPPRVRMAVVRHRS